MGDRLIFQLGTNNWQRGGEFAPGSGILHEAHHRAYNEIDGVRAYSMYPSRVQRFREEDVRVFELDHDIPICESVSPVSSYRWHAMSPDEVDAYRARLTREVTAFMDEVEASTGDEFALAIAHHAFMNPVVMRDVIAARVAAGKPRIPLVCFVHGTELKMFAKEQAGQEPEEFPLRFLPFMQGEHIFPGGVDVVASISSEQIDAFADVFPEFPRDRVVLSHNGYNDRVFRESDADPAAALASLADEVPDFDAVVAFCGKFADWKRLDALLRAAAQYEQEERRILTVVAGGGPEEQQRAMRDLVAELGLRRVLFLGPRQQADLATMFAAADVGVFPSYREPFGLVFLECMACGTPVIGADSGGPRDFVTPEVGVLVPETDDRQALTDSLAAAIDRALDEDWKRSKGPGAAAYAREKFSVVRQVSDLLAEVDRLTGH
ncbi:glycosyltransferase [Actinomycetospora soli]|uniref:glycosyltransferase n=1 Tax=Actinomycetospora soli TaxID=2893887 RepID=UPI001E39DF37|nr:glycosyltransferase [Actinomycetospora soli]MCD2189222.1 glycosyltransferase [Actinomycetospora soli]